jgi:TRAP-type C4-dicarboxylate transport system permease small subunit
MGKRWLIFVGTACCLAFASALVANSIKLVDPDSRGVLATLFVLAPVLVEMLLQPEPQHRAWVWLAVYFIGYLGIIAALDWIVRRLRERAGPADTALHMRAFEAAVWAAAGFMDILLRWKMKLEVVHGNEKAIQPGVQA